MLLGLIMFATGELLSSMSISGKIDFLIQIYLSVSHCSIFKLSANN